MQQRAQKRLAEMYLRDFARQAWPILEPGREYHHNWHIDAICDHLQAVSDGRIRRLIINIPPRCMKSLLVSVIWPAWEWITRPQTRFLFASYAQTLSIRDSVKCRRVIASPWYQERWRQNYRLTTDQNQKIRFDNDKTGYRLATSVGGALTGEGGDRVVIDDAHNAVEGESDVTRESTLEWWDQAMSTRLNNATTGAFVLVMQRLHDRDLCGHILAKEHDWDHLCLPMEYEPDHPTPTKSSLGFTDPRTAAGELLWSSHLPGEEVSRLKTRLGTYGTAGQLQQRPIPAGGGVFKKEWFRRFSSHGDYVALHDPDQSRRIMLADIHYIVTADLALSTKTSADWTVFCVWAVTPASDLILLDTTRIQAEAPDVEKIALQLARQRRIQWVGIEDAHYGSGVVQKMRREGVPVRKLVPDKDKWTRAQLPAVWAENGKIYLPEQAPWLQVWEDEVFMFPNAAHDDQVDALSYAAIMVRKTDGADDDEQDGRKATIGHWLRRPGKPEYPQHLPR